MITAVCLSVSDTAVLTKRLTACINSDLAQSLAAHRLQLNTSKTELIWFGIHLPNTVRSLSVHLSFRVLSFVRNLGVLFDSQLSMKQHVNKVASSCFYHLRRLRQLRCCVDQELMMRLVMSLVVSRLDYCNAVLAGLPASTIAPLQRVQNAAADS